LRGDEALAEEHVEQSEESAFPGLALPPGQLATERGAAVTVGVFDGVHRGHVHLSRALMAHAKLAGLRSVVVTFRNHPFSVLRPDFEPKYLCPVDSRIELLAATGVDAVVDVEFDAKLAELPAAEFVRLLCHRLNMKALVIGPDFALGKGREGDIAFLRAMGKEAGFEVEVVEPLNDGDARVDSTRVRKALSLGDVTGASHLLGRNFTLTGTVVKGVGRGGPLGFPTANLQSEDALAVPGNGIYAVWAHVLENGESRRLACATSIGVNPTFEGTERTVEAFVLDYDGDLYGSELTLEFVERLRDEVRFDSVEALQEQVDRDVAQTRAILSAERQTKAKRPI
jgi:riboflavin kinase / FMN adenylyltransferase